MMKKRVIFLDSGNVIMDPLKIKNRVNNPRPKATTTRTTIEDLKESKEKTP